jgi:hypothetical protein
MGGISQGKVHKSAGIKDYALGKDVIASSTPAQRYSSAAHAAVYSSSSDAAQQSHRVHGQDTYCPCTSVPTAAGSVATGLHCTHAGCSDGCIQAVHDSSTAPLWKPAHIALSTACYSCGVSCWGTHLLFKPHLLLMPDASLPLPPAGTPPPWSRCSPCPASPP